MRCFGISTFAMVAASILGSATALGINCRGAPGCNSIGAHGGDLDGVHTALAYLIADGYGDTLYPQGKQLGCDGTLCAFFQDIPAGSTPRVAYEKLKELRKHGCKGCGSDPLNFDPNHLNDVSYGQITVNFVSEPCCKQGHCYCL